MLALATHEPHFRVLREDVFANDKSSTACRMCGQEGHYAAQCTGTKAEIEKKPPAEKKPFIFLDVAVLREYLEVELDVPGARFDLERAIDDWVLLIFFVGNDFLPHLPSLEIREGAIDTLLKIWKQELPRMGGYLAEHGQLNLQRAQIILEGLAKREDDIFRRRREGPFLLLNPLLWHIHETFVLTTTFLVVVCFCLASERQDQNAKRRKIEQQKYAAGPSAALGLTEPTSTRPPIPERPKSNNNDFAASADSMGLGGVVAAGPESKQYEEAAAKAWSGSNRDFVAGRRAMRMANMTAAESLKAELAGLSPLKRSKDAKAEKPKVEVQETVPVPEEATPMEQDSVPAAPADDMEGVVGNGKAVEVVANGGSDVGKEKESDVLIGEADVEKEDSAVGAKRTFEEGPGSSTPVEDEDVIVLPAEDDEDKALDPLALKVNPDGSVEQEDLVK